MGLHCMDLAQPQDQLAKPSHWWGGCVAPSRSAEDTKKKSAEYYEALQAKEVYLHQYTHAPRHHQAIAVLSHHYSVFSGMVWLVKQWLGSHWLLHSHVSKEVIKLICASFFVTSRFTTNANTDTEQTIHHLIPANKGQGFAFMIKFLKDWKWEDSLFVPLYGADPAPSDKATFPKVGAMSVWKVMTEHDKYGHVWTSNGPDPVIAHCMCFG